MNVLSALTFGAKALRKKGLIEYRIETEVLLALTLNKSRVYLLAHPEQDLTKRQLVRFKKYIARRRKREPVAYITHTAHFMSLEFYVDKNVLIPRPETELLVESALSSKPLTLDPKTPSCSILDLGTGSGAIAISLAKSLPNVQITATDISAKALAIAKKNAKSHNVNIQFLKGDLFKPVKNRKFDLIIANPPYVSLSEYIKLSPQVKYEPKKALLAGKDGLNVIRRIIKEAPQYLKPNGILMFEIGAYQGSAVQKLAKQNGFERITVSKDYQGLDRVFFGSNSPLSPVVP